MKRDLYQEITDSIINAMESGTLPWQKDWKGGPSLEMPLRSTGECYQGINVLVLWMAAQKRGYASNQWFTFKQALSFDACVRKGEKGTTVVYWSTFKRDNGSEDPDLIPFLKAYTVFNAEQIDGLPERFTASTKSVDTGARPIAEMDRFFSAIGARIEHGQPSYNPSADIIRMPNVEQFTTAASYYGTLAHEMTHWTGHKSRLDRLAKFGAKEEYAKEELVAELGACFLTAQVGGNRDTERSASYIASWLQALRNDKKYIFKAASAASKATAYLMECAQTKQAAA